VLVAGIHALLAAARRSNSWMAGTSLDKPGHDSADMAQFDWPHTQQELQIGGTSVTTRRRYSAATWARACTSMFTSCSGDSVSSSMPQLFTQS